MERGQAVEVICRHTNYTRRYANMLLDIAGDEEIFRRVIEEGLSIHRAVELLKEKRKVYIEETVSGENEKPKIKEISAKGAIVEEIEPTRKSPKDISAKKPSFGEIFERAVRQVRSGCSIVMQGNIDADYGSWEEVLPQSMREPALIDRIQGLIPGWEMPKIMSADLHLSSGIGIAADVFSEIMHQMRSISASSIIRDNVEIIGQPSIRDERAITKIASALYKLLRPDLLGPGLEYLNSTTLSASSMSGEPHSFNAFE